MEFGFAHLCTVKPILLTPGYGEESADVEQVPDKELRAANVQKLQTH